MKLRLWAQPSARGGLRTRSCPEGTPAERDACMEKGAAALDRLDDAADRRELAVRVGCPERLADAVR